MSVEEWEVSTDPNWMIETYSKSNNPDIRLLILAQGICLNMLRPNIVDKRSRNALDEAIRFGCGGDSMFMQHSDTAYQAHIDLCYKAANSQLEASITNQADIAKSVCDLIHKGIITLNSFDLRAYRLMPDMIRSILPKPII